MKKIDIFRLVLQELKINCVVYFIAALVQVFLFTIIFLVSNVTFDLENAFERYIRENEYCDYYVEIKNVVYDDLQLLEDMGFSDIILTVEKLSEKEVSYKGKQMDDVFLFSEYDTDNSWELDIKEGQEINGNSKKDMSGVWLSEQTAKKYDILIDNDIEIKVNEINTVNLPVKGIYKGNDNIVYIPFTSFCSELYDELDFSITGTAIIDTIKGYVWKEIKLKRQGVIIWQEDIEEIVSVIMCAQIIFSGIMIVLYIMFFGTFSTTMSVKLYMRKEYIKMLFYMGCCQKVIKRIFLLLFDGIHLCSIIISLLLSKVCLNFLNYDIIDLKGLFFSEEIDVVYMLIFVIIDMIFLRFVFRKNWRKYVMLGEMD